MNLIGISSNLHNEAQKIVNSQISPKKKRTKSEVSHFLIPNYMTFLYRNRKSNFKFHMERP